MSPGLRLSLCFLLFSSLPASAEVTLQVLGSGGPRADDGRAGSGYLVWLDDHSRVLVDAGGGIFLRYAEAQASVDDLELVALTHFHADHAADLPALLKSFWFAQRRQPLSIAGPAGNGAYPSLEGFLESLLDPQRGAFRYLSGFINAADPEVFKLVPVTIKLDPAGTQPVMKTERITVTAFPVPHGPVPSLAYRIQANGVTLVISGDQTLANPAFTEFLQGADAWVMPFAIPENAGPAATLLHAKPSQIGQVARVAGVKTLVLSHFMARSLAGLDQQVARVRAVFDGEVLLAEDLARYPIQPAPATTTEITAETAAESTDETDTP